MNKHTPTDTVLIEIERLQNIQRTNPQTSAEWKQASAELAPLFKIMQERTNMMSKHTPTPWGVDSDTCITLGEDHDCWDEQGNAWFAEAYGQGRETDKANAEHIIACVNAHDDLVAALEDLATADNEGICRTGHHASWIALAVLEKVQQS